MRASITSTPAFARRDCDLDLQLLGDLRRVGAQRRLALRVRVVRMRRREIPDGRLGLHLDEVLVVVDLEHRLGRVDHPPDDDRADLDRVADRVVDLELGALEVADSQGDGPAREERAHPAQTPGLRRALVAAEELRDRRLIRVEDEETRQQEQDDEASR